MSVAETVASRGTVGVGILVAHLALLAMLASAGVIRTSTTVPPLAVTFLQPEEIRAKRSPVDQPVVTAVHQVLIRPPDVEVEMEPSSSAIAASVVDDPPLPPPPARAAGSAIIPEISDVAYLVQPAPRYPPESRRIREQGLVVLRVLIDERGHAKAVEILKSSGHPRLDEAARTAVSRAVFKPYMDGGIARTAAAIVPVEFSLRAAS